MACAGGYGVVAVAEVGDGGVVGASLACGRDAACGVGEREGVGSVDWVAYGRGHGLGVAVVGEEVVVPDDGGGRLVDLEGQDGGGDVEVAARDVLDGDAQLIVARVDAVGRVLDGVLGGGHDEGADLDGDGGMVDGGVVGEDGLVERSRLSANGFSYFESAGLGGDVVVGGLGGGLEGVGEGVVDGAYVGDGACDVVGCDTLAGCEALARYGDLAVGERGAVVGLGVGGGGEGDTTLGDGVGRSRISERVVDIVGDDGHGIGVGILEGSGPRGGVLGESDDVIVVIGNCHYRGVSGAIVDGLGRRY